MEKIEKGARETIIQINLGDLDDGYFVFSTSERKHFQRLIKRIGGKEKLLFLREERQKGKITWYECHIPKEFWSPTTFGIRPSGTKKAAHIKKSEAA